MEPHTDTRSKWERKMDISLEDIEAKEIMTFPMLPETINVQTGAIFQSYNILAVGDIKLPAGAELTGFSWEGILPGKARENEAYVSEWRNPKEIQTLWSIFRAEKRRLHLLVTETPIKHDVYLDNYTVDYKHGYGDYYYKIAFVQAKDLKIRVSAVAGAPAAPAAAPRTEPPPKTTYTVVKDDCLWAIAQKRMGSGSKYPQLYEANKEAIDARNKGTGNSKYTIYPGQVFTIPG